MRHVSQTALSTTDDDVVICYAKRTPLTKARKGGLSGLNPHQLLVPLFEDLKSVVNVDLIDDVCIGNVLGAGSCALDARISLMLAGYPDSCTSQTVNRMCSSGLQACAIIHDAIKSGMIDIGIGGGVESMTNNDMNGLFDPNKADDQMRACERATDCLIPMGVTSDLLASKFQVARRQIDEFASLSHQKANIAIRQGLCDEILPIFNHENLLISQDDGVRADTTADTLAKLRPSFGKTGVTTAGNSSQVSDGAAVILLARRSKARQLSLPILGRFIGYAVAGVPPSIMGIGPAVAVPQLLRRLAISKDAVDIFELNEAFGSQCLHCKTDLDLPDTKVNPRGGAIAIGHPLGATGARMIATLLSELRHADQRIGVVSMCIGTGMGMAALIVNEYKSQSLP